ncbi:xylulokinase [Rathayibacter sp. VKM Ac-2835]|uniref:xylulokinase n=1 Tax=Rathayibacter sp. VKM Ac-2835 TaxID=2739043 RepID=UPI0015665797|nr:xylulokinase [Rathayibacter sp. VKM Ac-2835]NRG43046.1 xylulokinase [Rathayibacter sp. VKM Ac-2835]
MTAAQLVAGVDSSTQSCKVELRDAITGTLIASGSATHPPVFPPISEQDPEMWWSAFVHAFRAALASTGAAADSVVAISVAAQCHGLVTLDSTDTVIRPAKLWNDTTSAPDIAQLRQKIGDETLLRSVGTLPTSAFTIGKLAWLARNEPAHLSRIAHILLPHDYLTFRLTGAYVTDRSEASGTGYFDAARNAYLPNFLDLITTDLDWDTVLPEVLAPDAAAGTVRPAVLEELGLHGTVTVGAGGGDQHATALGLGIRPGDVVYSFGTSGVVSALSRTPVYDLTGAVDGVADMTDGFMPLVSTLNAAKVTDTFARILGVDHATLSSLALAADTSDIGPVLAAFLDGERTPDRPGATGLLSGITSATTREQIARSAYEGVVLGLASGQRQLEQMGVSTDGTIIAVGGGAKSPAYTQILADVLQREIFTADVPESTARGAAVQAAAVAAGASVVSVRDEWAPETTIIAQPRTHTRDPWQRYTATASVTTLDRQ